METEKEEDACFVGLTVIRSSYTARRIYTRVSTRRRACVPARSNTQHAQCDALFGTYWLPRSDSRSMETGCARYYLLYFTSSLLDISPRRSLIHATLNHQLPDARRTRPASFDRSPTDDIASPRPIKILRDFRRWYDASPSTNQRGFDDKSVGTIDSFCALPCQS